MARLLAAGVVWLLLLAPHPGAHAEAAVDCPPVARAPTPEQLAAAARAAHDRGFLWRVSKAGRTSYLYGTLHVGRPDWVAAGPTITHAVQSSDVVALELDLLDPAVMQRLQAGMARRPDQAIDASLAQRLQRQLQAACLPRQLLNDVAPEMVATLLTALAGRRDGLDPANAIDTSLSMLGRQLGKPVRSLETPELQLSLVLGRTPAERHAIVEQAVDELESGQAASLLPRIAEVWSQGRLAELEAYEAWCDCVHSDADRAIYRRLLDGRNPGLAARIDALHRGGQRVFAAVGSLHMIGPHGLPALLGRMGYRVERVPLQ